MPTPFDAGFPALNTRNIVVVDGQVTPDGAGCLWSDRGVTGSNGRVVFSVPLATAWFQNPPHYQVSAHRDSTATTAACFAQIISRVDGSLTVQVWESRTSGVLIGGTVEGLEPAGAGVTVDLLIVGVPNLISSKEA